eukprot:EG_transcript_10434
MGPSYPSGSVPIITIHHPALAVETLKEVALQLEEEARTLLGEPMVYQLHQKAQALLQDLPLASLSEFFVWCPSCSDRLGEKGMCRYPQAAEQVKFTSMHHQDRQFKCLRCGSQDVHWLSCVRRNVVRPCSWCFCPENPLITLRCGEEVCTDCFNLCVGEAVGKKSIHRLQGQAYAAFTVHCPVHPGVSIFAEPQLVRLLEAATLERFLHFAFQEGAACAGLVECPLSGCTNAPFWPDTLGNFLECPYCLGRYCVQCKLNALDCHCEALLRDERRDTPPDDSAAGGGDTLDDLAGPRPGALRVAVKYPGKRLGFEVWVTPATVLADLKRLVQAELRIPRQYQLLFLAGRPLLDATSEFLKDLQVFSTLHVARRAPQDPALRQQLKWRWRVRRGLCSIPASEGYAIGKLCPFKHCHKPVVHYRNHGCHHITGCCGQQWCYNCHLPSPCTCRIFCSDDCDCPWCPDCKPFEP